MSEWVLSARLVISSCQHFIGCLQKENLEIHILFLHRFHSVLQIIKKTAASDVYSKSCLFHFLVLGCHVQEVLDQKGWHIIDAIVPHIFQHIHSLCLSGT